VFCNRPGFSKRSEEDVVFLFRARPDVRGRAKKLALPDIAGPVVASDNKNLVSYLPASRGRNSIFASPTVSAMERSGLADVIFPTWQDDFAKAPTASSW
jgi:hypothetical protein